ncbi:MAG: hypothetical protein Q9215_005161 [Flavoplaca cf. flavocitrina]
MSAKEMTTRRAYRRTDDYTPGKPRIEVVTEPLPLPLSPTKVLIKVHAVALNYRDANISNGGNPWPVTPRGIIGKHAPGEIIGVGDQVEFLKISDRVAPNADTENLTGTGDVAIFALKLAKAIGLKVVLSSSSDQKLKVVCEQFPEPPILTVNYAKNSNWHEKVLKYTNGVGVDIVIENGGPGTLLKSMKCTRRGGIVSQVGYLNRKRFDDAHEILPTLIDRRVILRGINAGSKSDVDDLCTALTATQIKLDDIIDSTWAFDDADKALQYLWEGKQVGKLVIEI